MKQIMNFVPKNRNIMIEIKEDNNGDNKFLRVEEKRRQSGRVIAFDDSINKKIANAENLINIDDIVVFEPRMLDSFEIDGNVYNYINFDHIICVIK